MRLTFSTCIIGLSTLYFNPTDQKKAATASTEAASGPNKHPPRKGTNPGRDRFRSRQSRKTPALRQGRRWIFQKTKPWQNPKTTTSLRHPTVGPPVGREARAQQGFSPPKGKPSSADAGSPKNPKANSASTDKTEKSAKAGVTETIRFLRKVEVNGLAESSGSASLFPRSYTGRFHLGCGHLCPFSS